MSLEFLMHLAGLIFIVSGLLAGQQLLLFDSGLLCLGTAAFFAVGAYCSALLSKILLWSPFLSISVSSFLTAIFALVIGMLFLSFLRHDFFALATLALAQVVYVILRSAAPGGSAGMGGIPRLQSPLSNFISSEMDSLILCFLFVAFCFSVVNFVRTRRFGMYVLACRDDENALRALGVRTLLVKVQVFSTASLLAGAAGAFHAHYLGAIEPKMSSITNTVLIVCGTILCGRKNVFGCLFGAFFLAAIPEILDRVIQSDAGKNLILRFTDDPWKIFPLMQISYGLLVIIIALFIFPRIKSALRSCD